MSKQNLVSINLHGVLGKEVGRQFKLAVKSVGECINAIDVLTKQKLRQTLIQKDRENIKYRVLINQRDFLCEETPTIEKPETIADSELMMKKDDLRTIDIIPVIEGADNVLTAVGLVVGAVLIATGIGAAAGVGFLSGLSGVAGAITVAGIGLVTAGVINLLSSPPDFGDFREIDDSQGRRSFLFNGPVNTVGEGGPVPVGYGRIIAGSQVISETFLVENFDAEKDQTAAPDEIAENENRTF